MVGPMSTSSFIKPRTFPVPADEPERLKALAGYGIVGAPPPPDLPSVVELAAYVCGVPTAVVNIISVSQQLQMAAYGFEASACAREDSMCAISIVGPETVVVRDATQDPRFADSPPLPVLERLARLARALDVELAVQFQARNDAA